MGFYDNYIRLCNERGEPPTRVAIDVGVDRSAATRWSKGAMPRYAVLLRIADHFGVGVSDLLGNGAPVTAESEPIIEVEKEASPKEETGLEAALEALRNQPGRRALLSATKTMTEAQVLRLADWISDLRGDDGD